MKPIFPKPHNSVRDAYKLMRRLAVHRAILTDAVHRLWSCTENDFKDPELGRMFSEVCREATKRTAMDLEDPILNKLIGESKTRFDELIPERRKKKKEKKNETVIAANAANDIA